MALQQATRLLQVKTPLGENAFLLTAINGSELVSGLFEFQLELLGDEVQVVSRDIIGKDISFSIETSAGSTNHFHGVVSEFSQVGRDSNGRSRFQATVVPWTWLLTQNGDYRIFQNQTVPQIVEQVFRELGHVAFEFRLRKSYETLEYRVQYEETDFAFVSRLLEDEGIFYFFERSNGRHVLVLADSAAEYSPCDQFEMTVSDIECDDCISVWQQKFAFHRGDTVGAGFGQTDIQPEMVTGESRCQAFRPGRTIKVGENQSQSTETGQTFVLLSVDHSASEPYDAGGLNRSAKFAYANAFSCIPAGVVARPQRVTKRPIVSGIQTAVVVGPQGKAVYTDDQGRVKIQFHWEAERSRHAHSSRWVRVSHTLASQPAPTLRVGQEVVVDFIDGNPDQPLIVGVVNEADSTTKPVTAAVESKASLSIVGSARGGELVFGDGDGLSVRPSSNPTPQTPTTSELAADQSVVEGNHRIEGDWSVRVGDDSSGGRVELVCEDSWNQQVNGDHNQIVQGASRTRIDGKKNEVIGGDDHRRVAGNLAVEAGSAHLNAGANVVIEAGMTLTLKGPGGFITISPAGIDIQGSMVKINSGGTAGTGVACDPELPEPVELPISDRTTASLPTQSTQESNSS